MLITTHAHFKHQNEHKHSISCEEVNKINQTENTSTHQRVNSTHILLLFLYEFTKMLHIKVPKFNPQPWPKLVFQHLWQAHYWDNGHANPHTCYLKAHNSPHWLPHWPPGMASASEWQTWVQFLLLQQIFLKFESYQWLKPWYGNPAPTLPGAWHYGVSTETGSPGVSILSLGQMANLI